MDDSLYRLIVENAEDYAIFVVDASRRVLTWNPGAARLLGYTAAEMIGRSADVIFTPEDREEGEPEREERKAIASGKAYNDRWHMRKDGSRFWASGLMIRLDDGPGGVRGLAKIMRDQTSLKLAEQERDRAEAALRASEQKFRRLIEANIIGVGIANAAGAWIDANDALLRILGHAREDLGSGRVRWDRMTPPEYRALDERAISMANRRGACPPYEKEYVREDGTRIPVLLGFAAVSGIEGHYICFVLDLTRQKRVEQALRDADQRKDEFLAMLAHELRNPLSAIANASQVVRWSESEEEVEWANAVIDKHVGALSRMIDDLLDVSRITRGKIELRTQPLEVFPLVTHAAETVRPFMEGKGHELVIEQRQGTAWVEADPHRLEQVLVNLLANAAKYTDRGGRIALSVAPEDGEVAIAVADNGSGIPPERIPQMFELFAQGDRSAARSEGGLGIGLTLVKNLVEMHGGTVTARSEGPGTGSEFTVRLPTIPAPKAEPTSAAPAGGTLRKGLRVLVVDDNEDTARGLVSLLRLAELEVETAFDGPSAVEAAHRHRPEVVLLDIGLPGMDGYEVARRLRAEGFADAMIIAVSGYGEEAARARSHEAGFDDYLVKPVDHDALVALMQKVR